MKNSLKYNVIKTIELICLLAKKCANLGAKKTELIIILQSLFLENIYCGIFISFSFKIAVYNIKQFFCLQNLFFLHHQNQKVAYQYEVNFLKI